MISIKEVKKKARESLERNMFGNIWLLLIVVSLICGAVLGIPFVSLILAGAVAYAAARIYIKIVRGEKKVDLNDMLCGFNEDFTATILLGVMRALFDSGEEANCCACCISICSSLFVRRSEGDGS